MITETVIYIFIQIDQKSRSVAGFGIYLVHVHLSQSHGLPDGLELVAMMWGQEGGGRESHHFLWFSVCLHCFRWGRGCRGLVRHLRRF